MTLEKDIEQSASQLKTREMVEHPPHYTSHPSGIECIEITRHMGFNLGNAFKYIYRCDLKDDPIENMEKAIWYLRDEIKKRREAKKPGVPIPVRVLQDDLRN